MKKFLVTISTFLFVIIICDRIVSFALSNLIEKSGFRYARINNIESNDFVVIGNSRGVNSVSEKFSVYNLGHRVINLSYNGFSPVIMNQVITDLNNDVKFKHTTFLIEASIFLGWEEVNISEDCVSELKIKNNESIPDILLPFRFYFPSVNRSYKNLYPLNNLFHLLNYNNEGFLRSIYYLKNKDDNWVNRKQINNFLIEYYSNLKCICFSFDEDNFENFIKTIKNNDIKVNFFVAPWHKAYKSKFINYDTILNLIESKYNFNLIRLDNLILNDSVFADGMHTNNKVVNFLSKKLFENIKIEESKLINR